MKNVATTLILTALCLACAGENRSDGEGTLPAQGAPDRIGIAMRGAPMGIASGATITDFDAAGNMVELRAGTNGWLCIADDAPAAPGDSPDCLDERWQQWFDAYAKRETPKISGVGLAYMLQGSLSASNTDPFAETPPAGASWMEDGPHVMLVVPDPQMLDGFPSDHGSGGPYVMWRGTPYAHLMVPVGSH